jgi:hypothetical protein
VFSWLFILFYFGTGLTVLIQVWIDESRIEDVSSILISMISFGGVVLGVYTAGRSWEKRYGEDYQSYESSMPPTQYSPSERPPGGHFG